MRHPIWIFNNALLVLLVCVSMFMFLVHTTVPERENIDPDVYIKPVQKDEVQINIAQIYENDLFGTYKKEFLRPDNAVYAAVMPEPPVPEAPVIPAIPKPQFLDPLSITLKGIIFVGYDESKNRAIIFDEKTAREKSYKVEEMIEDAQIIKILPNKVILLRSNGQQEVLHLREFDAKIDPTYAPITGWEMVIKKTGPYAYRINPMAFLERVHDLAQFIDLLDLTTVYKQGKSIGCRVGTLEANSLGIALGLYSSDIITRVNEIPAIDTPHRYSIYQEIIHMQSNDVLSVEIMRNGATIMIYYTLEDFMLEPPVSVEVTKSPAMIEQEKKQMLQQRQQFVPTIEELRKRERQNMLERGRAPKTDKPSSSE